jgi:hypothetical protein
MCNCCNSHNCLTTQEICCKIKDLKDKIKKYAPPQTVTKECTLIEYPLNTITPGVQIGDVNNHNFLINNGLRFLSFSSGPFFQIQLVASNLTTFTDDLLLNPLPRAIRCGIRETFVNEPGILGGQFPPLDRETSIMLITLDNQSSTLNYTFDLFLRYSTERTLSSFVFDPVIIYKNGSQLFSNGGAGPSAMNPYLGATLNNITLSSTDVLMVTFRKDINMYAGLDSTYFYIKNLCIK